MPRRATNDPWQTLLRRQDARTWHALVEAFCKAQPPRPEDAERVVQSGLERGGAGGGAVLAETYTLIVETYAIPSLRIAPSTRILGTCHHPVIALA